MSTVARGEFHARISDDEQSIDYKLMYSGLQGKVTQAHIHVAQRSVNGSIVIWRCGTETNSGPSGTQTCPPDQDGNATSTGTITTADVVAASMTSQQLAAAERGEVIAVIRAGVAYANVHTDLSPGGEIRG